MRKPRAVRHRTVMPSRVELVTVLAAAGLLIAPVASADAGDAGAWLVQVLPPGDGGTVGADYGVLVFKNVENVRLSIDGRDVGPDEATAGMSLPLGDHRIAVKYLDGTELSRVLPVAAGTRQLVELPIRACEVALGGAPPVPDYYTVHSAGCCGHESIREVTSNTERGAVLSPLLGVLALAMRKSRRQRSP